MNYRRVDSNNIEKYHTVEELVKIFKIEDERPIISAFGKNLVFFGDKLILESKYLIDQLGIDPEEPFMTRREVMKELDIDFAQFTKLVRVGMLKKFKLVSAKGSSILLLKKDVEECKKIRIYYDNPKSLINHNRSIVQALKLIFEYDYKYIKAINEKPKDHQIMVMYFTGGFTISEISKAMDVSGETVRSALKRSASSFDRFFDGLAKTCTENEKLQNDNRILQLEKQELEKKIEHLESFIKASPLDESAIFDVVEVYNVICSIRLERDVPMSVRLKNNLSDIYANYRGLKKDSVQWDEVDLKWLLQVPGNFFLRKIGFGKKTFFELQDILSQRGLRMNGTTEFIKVEIGNVEQWVGDSLLALKFSKRYKDSGKV